MIACFDLRRRLPTYDYFTWQTHVKLLGATEITFAGLGGKYKMDKRWPHAETERRYHNYLRPGPALSDLPCREGEDGDRAMGSHLYLELWRDAVRLTAGQIPLLRSPLGPGAPRGATVTIRETDYKAERNSEVDLWRTFAREIGADLIEDTRRQPINLDRRMWLYASATMNYGVPNGPLSMLFLSPYPVAMFCDPPLTAPDWSRQGIAVGAQLPWARANQRLIWQKPTLEALLLHYEEHVLRHRGAAR